MSDNLSTVKICRSGWRGSVFGVGPRPCHERPNCANGLKTTLFAIIRKAALPVPQADDLNTTADEGLTRSCLSVVPQADDLNSTVDCFAAWPVRPFVISGTAFHQNPVKKAFSGGAVSGL